MKLDNAFAALPGIKFFLSSCTATSTKTKTDDFIFGVSHFIVAENDKNITESRIFDLVYDTEPKIKTSYEIIKKKPKATKQSEDHVMLNKLATVLKVVKFASIFYLAGVLTVLACVNRD